jgi:prepilin-type processing-associated H-X9-DG protein
MLALLFSPLVVAWTKPHAATRSIICLRNHHQLIQAWLMYAGDYDQQVCNNFTIPDTESAITAGQFNTWANNIMNWTASDGLTARSVTNLDWVRRGVLARYSDDPVGMVKCHADTFLSPAQRKSGWKGRVRSVSMNALMGLSDNSPTSLAGRAWVNTTLRQLLRLSDIPDPERTWVTSDEHADSINDGFFIALPGQTLWGDLPGSYHDGMGTYSFADGHAELHSWLSRNTKKPVTFTYMGQTFDSAARKDYRWLLDHSAFIPFR